MLKPLSIGLGILVVTATVALILQDATILIAISGIVGVGGIVLATLFSGMLNNGDRIRANYHTETKEQRYQRTGTSITMFLIGLPNFIAMIFISIYFY